MSYTPRWYNTVFLQIQSNGFSQLPMADPENYQQVFTRENYYTLLALGLAQRYTWNQLTWLESTLQASGFYSKTRIYPDYRNKIPPQNGMGLHLSSYNSLIFNKKKNIIGEINYTYNTPSNNNIYQ